MSRRAQLTLHLLLWIPGGVAANAELDATFPQSSVVIDASRDACYRFGVYLALDTAQQRRGLMHVKALDRWRGMLFVYEGEQRRSMWMKNTFLPLDMLFIEASGRISSIVTDTEPQSLRSIASAEPVQYVLELNAGVTEELHIGAGDRVIWAGDVTLPSEN